MASFDKFTWVQFTGKEDYEAKQSMLQSVRQHVMEDYSRQQTESDNKTKTREAVAPDILSRKTMKKTPSLEVLSDAERLLITLKEDEALPWKEIAARIKTQLGQSITVATLQMRHLRLKQQFRTWEERDIEALRQAHEYWEKCKWDIISAKMLEFGVDEEWPRSLCARKWAAIAPQHMLTSSSYAIDKHSTTKRLRGPQPLTPESPGMDRSHAAPQNAAAPMPRDHGHDNDHPLEVDKKLRGLSSTYAEYHQTATVPGESRYPSEPRYPGKSRYPGGSSSERYDSNPTTNFDLDQLQGPKLLWPGEPISQQLADVDREGQGSDSRIYESKLLTQTSNRISRRSLSPMDHTSNQNDQQLPDLTWIMVANPHQSKDKDMMRNIRIKVMNDYLTKERRTPHSTDARVRHTVTPFKRPSSSDRILSFGYAKPFPPDFGLVHHQLPNEEQNPAGTEELWDCISDEKNPSAFLERASLLESMPRKYHDPMLEPEQSHCAQEDACKRVYKGSSNTHDNSPAADTDRFRDSELCQQDEATWQKLADLEEDRKLKQFADRSNNEISRVLTDTESAMSSGESMDDFDDLFLDTEVSRLRTWLFERSGSGHFCRHLQRRLTFAQCQSSTLQKQSADSTPGSSSLPDSFVSSSSTSCTTAVSYGPVNNGKRKQNDGSDQDEQQHKKKHSAQDKSQCKPAPRLACLFNKYDPMMYRSNAQTNKKFELCGMHDFQNMNKLYEHLKRVHSDQPLQCQRCARMGFGSSGELQAHQIALEACSPVPLTAEKRIKWITHDERIALQTAISRRLRGGTDEEKWRFACRWLFPNTDAENIPCPYLEDPVISIVSSVVDDFDTRLREYIRTSSDLEELESRIWEIRGQFLAQYGIRVNDDERSPLSLTSLTTASSSSRSGRLATTTPPDVADQPQLTGDTNHDQPVLSSDSQQDLNVSSTGINAHHDAPLEPLVTSDPVWLHHDDFPTLDDIPGWDPSTWNPDYDTTNDANNSLFVTETSKDIHGFGPLIQKESQGFT